MHRITTILLLLSSLVGLSAAAIQEPAPAQEPEAPFTGDAYSLATCPVSGEPLGGMGDPVRVELEGRALLVCCKGCVKKLQTEPTKYLGAVDEELTRQQRAYYPLDTCLVSGKSLTKDGKDVAVEGIVLNRLFRVCCNKCLDQVRAHPKTYFETLDASVAKAQRPTYPLTACITNAKSPLGAMGEPVERVVGNRLVRFCCEGCLPKFDEDVAGHLARLDTAWEEQRARQAAEAEKE
ncbi:MAG: hypothetical protein H6828_08160 [Planctomycetes bacterium]|nr:hypothetical protein [Planctomycetota bacterium]